MGPRHQRPGGAADRGRRGPVRRAHPVLTKDARWLARAPHPASGFIVAGAVWVRKTTPTHITAKAAAATARTPTPGLNRSSNSHTLRAILTIGSTITRNGWETRSGPTCSATCCRIVPAAPPTARAYTGQRVNIPATPNWVRVSVVALMIVASSAQMVADAAAYRAARRPGDPQRAATARTAAPAPQVTAATTQCWLVGVGWPPSGSPATMNTARPRQVRAAASQVIPRMDWWIQNRRSARANTSSVTRSGCTTETRPSCRASAWNRNAPARATQPKSHSGLWNRYRTTRQPDDRRGPAVLAMC